MISLIIVSFLLAGSCFVDGAVIVGDPHYDEVIWEISGSPYSLDPHVNYESNGDWIFYNVYETLYTFPWDGYGSEPDVPLLAASVPIVSADGLTYTIELRQGVTFHDGTPFNASCVKWNFERALKISDEVGPVWMIAEPLRGGKALMEIAYTMGSTSQEFKDAFDIWVASSGAINVLADYIIEFVLEEPYQSFIPAISTSVGSIISPTYAISHAYPTVATWEDYGVDYGENVNYMHDLMCGTGPYMLLEWVVDDYIHLEQNADYWRGSTSTNAGYIESVQIKTNPDTNSRILNLEAGIIDGCYWPKTEADEIYEFPDGSVNPDIYVSEGGNGFNLNFASFNMANVNIGSTSFTSPFRNINFRRAAIRAFPYEEFIVESLHGFGVRATGPIPAGMFGHYDAFVPLETNLEYAVNQWNDAMDDPDFVDSLNQLDNTIVLHYRIDSQVMDPFYFMMQHALEDIWAHPNATLTGLNSTMECIVEGLDWTLWIESFREQRQLITLSSWTADYADPDDYLFPLIHHQGYYANRIGYNNTAVNLLCEDQKSETDTTARRSMLFLIQQAVNQDIPYLWLAQDSEFRVWRSWLQGDGLVWNPMHDVYFYNVYKTGGLDPQLQDPLLTNLLLIGISAEIVIVASLIVIRWSRSKSRSD